ncbi:MAG: hypothetical protein ABJA86_11150 [Nocardioidaceae bacterium]
MSVPQNDPQTTLPELFPMLSRGKHRNPRKGACFMELASYLAGERWSDHPECTHPLLAQLARLVNDHTSDARRPELAELTPLVIGLKSDDIRVDARIALRAARVALPVVSALRQNAMAVAALRADRVLGKLDGRPLGNLDEQTRVALAQAPQAVRWARDFVGDSDISESRFRRYAAPSAVRSAVQGIAQACIADPDRLLRELLVEGIRDCAAECGKTSRSDTSSREIVTS